MSCASLIVLLTLPHGAQAQEAAVPAATASADQSDALLRLGDYYSDGVSVPADYAKALEYYKQAADAGRDRGTLRIAEMLMSGQGGRVDVEGGLTLLHDLANDGYPAALLVLGEHYFTGIEGYMEADPQRGIGLYRKAAAAGDATALIALGDALSSGTGGTADPAEVLSAYQQAADLGRVDAFLRIGDHLSSGRLVPVDLGAAYVAYKNASDSGSSTGTLRMAEMLARGHGVAPDVETGLSLIRKLAEAGNGAASVLLGQLLISGDVGPIDAAGAVTAFEAAADAGRSEALVQLGQMFGDGLVAPVDRSRSLAYLERASDAGSTYALYLLGRGLNEGRFARSGSSTDGLDVLEKARGAGVDEASVGIANAHLYGYGFPQDPAAAIEILDREASAGNLAAGERLLALYRDGSQDGDVTLVQRRAETARAYLALIAPRLDRSELLIETLLLEAAFAPSGRYDFLDKQFAELPPGDQASLLRNLADVAPNAYVYLLQGQLTRIGLYDGPRHGLLDQRTISAMLRFCDSKNVSDQCRWGPLTSRSAQILSYAF